MAQSTILPLVSVSAANAFDSRYLVSPGTGYDGVGMVTFGGIYGSGALLSTGQHVLTAAHVAEHWTGSNAYVIFNMSSGSHLIGINTVRINPGWDTSRLINDIAIVELAAPAPTGAERYEIHRGTDEVGQTVRRVGYGVPGTGANGRVTSGTGAPTKRQGLNRYDALGSIFVGDGDPAGTQLAYDFDDGTVERDAFGHYYGLSNLGLGLGEVSATSGDSGGPVFIGNRIAGITSYGMTYWGPTDAVAGINFSFGEFGVDTRISSFAGWIDSTLAIPVGSGSGGGTGGSSSAPGSPFRGIGGDFDGNGLTDVLFRREDAALVLWRVGSNGTYAESVVSTLRDPRWQVAGTADLTGDGRADILFQRSDGTIALWTMNGAAVEATKVIGTLRDPFWTIRGTADLDGDRRPDLIMQNPNGGLAAWIMDGAGSVRQYASLGQLRDLQWQLVSAADADGDARADLVFRHGNGSVAVWRMAGTSVLVSSVVGTGVPESWRLAAVGDTNGDGRADLVWQRPDYGVVRWALNGTGAVGAGVIRDADPSGAEVVGIGDYNLDGAMDLLAEDSVGAFGWWDVRGGSVVANDFRATTAATAAALADAPALPDGGNRLTVSGIDRLRGGAGFDEIAIGADVPRIVVENVEALIGSAGDDIVDVVGGGSVITGGGGADVITLWSGAAADRIVFRDLGEGGDAVLGFRSGMDAVVLDRLPGLAGAGPVKNVELRSEGGVAAFQTAMAGITGGGAGVWIAFDGSDSHLLAGAPGQEAVRLARFERTTVRPEDIVLV
ncbi:FG-GAP-like repeat-containing protein [Arenibaculum pallidiluteum]|uniref:FG-GAP-like repeat-containing protein n=1 Tax=Arenibaculum pallidiluteum TaxID=2812559 RepID=UPI001A9740B2|nr:FG-GAP-like repeat-containing protein [Arenibaculum pallidiluteum]